MAIHAGTIIVLVAGLVITVGMAVGARLLRNDNEDRLLGQRLNEVAAVAKSAISTSHVPLLSAAAVAATTDGDPKAFQALMDPVVKAGVPYGSVSLWPTGSTDPHPLYTIGAPPKLATESPAQIAAVIDHAADATNLSVVNLLGGKHRRLGYALSSPGSPGAPSKFVVYGETKDFPRSRQARIAKDSAFSDFDYALYLGEHPNRDTVVASSTGDGEPFTGRTASVAVPYGDQKLLVVLSPRGDLGGTLLARLPWALLALGLIITLAAAALVERLIRQRERAEDLADELEKIAAENARLLADQRTVAYTLQHSLLPETLPEVDGFELGFRYIAGVEGVDIGGDWYDVVELDDGQVTFVVGDVSGRGLRAATIMASLRYSIRAYAIQGDAPTVILTKLSKLLDVSRDGSFATVLCGRIDLARRRLTIASAGHPYPLLIVDGAAEYVMTDTGVPVGVNGSAPYASVTVDIPAQATLLVYTDGLIERRGESLDAGLERLRDAARGADRPLERMLSEIVSALNQVGSDDDTAVLGVRWSTAP